MQIQSALALSPRVGTPFRSETPQPSGYTSDRLLRRDDLLDGLKVLEKQSPFSVNNIGIESIVMPTLCLPLVILKQSPKLAVVLLLSLFSKGGAQEHGSANLGPVYQISPAGSEKQGYNQMSVLGSTVCTEYLSIGPSGESARARCFVLENTDPISSYSVNLKNEFVLSSPGSNQDNTPVFFGNSMVGMGYAGPTGYQWGIMMRKANLSSGILSEARLMDGPYGSSGDANGQFRLLKNGNMVLVNERGGSNVYLSLFGPDQTRILGPIPASPNMSFLSAAMPLIFDSGDILIPMYKSDNMCYGLRYDSNLALKSQIFFGQVGLNSQWGSAYPDGGYRFAYKIPGGSSYLREYSPADQQIGSDILIASSSDGSPSVLNYGAYSVIGWNVATNGLSRDTYSKVVNRDGDTVVDPFLVNPSSSKDECALQTIVSGSGIGYQWNSGSYGSTEYKVFFRFVGFSGLSSWGNHPSQLPTRQPSPVRTGYPTVTQSPAGSSVPDVSRCLDTIGFIKQQLPNDFVLDLAKLFGVSSDVNAVIMAKELGSDRAPDSMYFDRDKKTLTGNGCPNGDYQLAIQVTESDIGSTKSSILQISIGSQHSDCPPIHDVRDTLLWVFFGILGSFGLGLLTMFLYQQKTATPVERIPVPTAPLEQGLGKGSFDVALPNATVVSAYNPDRI